MLAEDLGGGLDKFVAGGICPAQQRRRLLAEGGLDHWKLEGICSPRRIEWRRSAQACRFRSRPARRSAVWVA